MVRALGVLDTRYAYIPGWRPLPRHPRLMQAAADVSSAVAADDVDTSVDARGWRPQPTLSLASREAGLGGAAVAQHNVVIELGRFPTALNLRRVMHLQAQVSALAARHARGGAPDLAARFKERGGVYRQLVAHARNLGGLVGAGAGAVCASHATLECLRSATVGARILRDELDELGRAFSTTDARITVLIERGLADRSYFVSVTVPRITNQTHHGVQQPRTRYMPADTQPMNEILPLVRRQSLPRHTPSHPRQHAGDEPACPRGGTESTLSSRLPSYALTSIRTPWRRPILRGPSQRGSGALGGSAPADTEISDWARFDSQTLSALRERPQNFRAAPLQVRERFRPWGAASRTNCAYARAHRLHILRLWRNL